MLGREAAGWHSQLGLLLPPGRAEVPSEEPRVRTVSCEGGCARDPRSQGLSRRLPPGGAGEGAQRSLPGQPRRLGAGQVLHLDGAGGHGEADVLMVLRRLVRGQVKGTLGWRVGVAVPTTPTLGSGPRGLEVRWLWRLLLLLLLLGSL